jgi:16S rRNA (cytosine1402-N4)-methyltransferase
LWDKEGYPETQQQAARESRLEKKKQRRYRRSLLKQPQPEAIHVPVLLQTAIELLNVRPGARYIDCTLGTGGHAAAILGKCLPGGSLLGIDADPKAIEMAGKLLGHFGPAVVLVNENFRHLEDICNRYSFRPVDGILFDLGISSLQLEDMARGFSFRFDAPLDMRFNPAQSITAANMVNRLSEGELADIFRQYGEEHQSRLIARRIVSHRPINTTLQLVEIVEQASGSGGGRIHPATRTFQALRIAVNHELANLEEGLKQAVELLHPGGRLVVISYHSLEDRIVKQFMQRESKGCLCPPDVPLCGCRHTPVLKIISQKAIMASPAEIEANPRSRSAKLRAAERL